MKAIKFRVWDKVRQKMFKPQAISFDTQTLAQFAVSVPGRSWEPAEKFELLRWTGLSDANGTDVYERPRSFGEIPNFGDDLSMLHCSDSYYPPEGPLYGLLP